MIALTLLGGVLRFATLNVSSLDLDESATLILVHRDFAGMLSHLVSSESAPPLYYVLVWVWTKVFGAGAVGFRSFSALVGTLTIPVMYLAGRHISVRIGVWTAILTTVSPSMYLFSQEARCYALLLLFSAAAFVYWQRALEDPSRRHLALWSGMSILALLSHYFAAFLFIPEAIVLAARLGWRRIWAAAGAVVLVGLALVPLAAAQRADGKTNWIEDLSLSGRIGESVKMFTVGAYGPVVLYALVVAVLIVACAVLLVWRYGDGRERAGAADAAIIGVSAVGLPLVLAVTHRDRRVRRPQRDRVLDPVRGARGRWLRDGARAARRRAAGRCAVRDLAGDDRGGQPGRRLPAQRLAGRRARPWTDPPARA